MKFDLYTFNQLTVHNVPVLFKNIPWANGYVYIRVLIGVGSRFDPVGREGLAHYFEHLPFNGSKNHPSLEAIQSFDRRVLFDTLNANTNFERTMFHAKTSVERLEQAVAFLADMIFRPLITTESVERERKVITQEFWRNFTNRRQVELSKMIKESLYGDHVFSRVMTPLGLDTSIQAITRDDLVRFHSDYYHLGNIRLLIVGDVDEPLAQRATKVLSDNAPFGEAVSRVEKPNFWPNPIRPEISFSAEDFFGHAGQTKQEDTRIRVYRVMPIQENEKVLGISTTLVRHLLFERIRYKLGATYSPGVHWSKHADSFSLKILLNVAPETERQICEIVSGVISEIAHGDQAHMELFSEMKTAYIERKTYSDETAEEIADAAADEFATIGKILSVAEDIESANAASYEDAASLFRRELSPSQLMWHVLRP